MLTELKTPCPASLACSARGWSSLLVTHHGRKNRERGFPNQDAGHVWQTSSNRWLIGSVADGHGGDLHPRSSIGSRYASLAAYSEWTQQINQRPELRPVSEENVTAARSFPQYLTDRWRETIREYHSHHPWQPDDFNGLSPIDRRELLDDPMVGYGSTLLTVAAHRNGLLAAQLGDGAMVGVSDNGTAHFLIPPVEHPLANATDSLCHTNAHYRFQTSYLPLGRNCPAMLLLTTDGYVNAFASTESFLQAVTDYWKLWKRRGQRYIARHLGQWIAEATDATSFDDATVLLLFRRSHWGGTSP